MKKPLGAKWQLDVVLVVAVKNEFIALLDWVAQLEKKLPQTIYRLENNQLGDAEIKFEILQPSGIVIRYHVYKLPHPSMGGDATTFIATKAIYTIKPFVICMIGICAGNPSETKLGDVIVASATVRTDFGKLEKPDDKAQSELLQVSTNHFNGLKFSHRVNTNIRRGIDGSIFRLGDLMSAIKEYNSLKSQRLKDISIKGHKVLLGIIASGNQIVKVKGAFEYLKNKIVGNVGDEDERILLGLEMEAHSLAYAASQAGNVGWLIVKGVADYADGKKNDTYHGIALSNAFDFIKWMLPQSLELGFGRVGLEKKALEKLLIVKEAYENGKIEEASAQINALYVQGLRSIETRKLMVKCLMRAGKYSEAEDTLNEYKKRRWFNDALTTELLAEIKWREGDNKSMEEVLAEFKGPDTSQLLYLKAMLLVFKDSAPQSPNDKVERLLKAEKLLAQAIEQSKSSPQPFYDVNHYFVCKLLDKSKRIKTKDLNASYKRALSTTSVNLNARRHRGLIYMYYLLLFVIADKEDEVIKFIKKYKDQDIVVALDNIDMIYKRIELVYADNIPNAEKYLLRLSKFIWSKRTYGNVIRPETRGRMEGHKKIR
ncbi:MAG: hypothetical protein JWO03_1697 [Bacteroidetes bacterium]|nr:hypothetical protein [Bacteroidota bacterium]